MIDSSPPLFHYYISGDLHTIARLDKPMKLFPTQAGACTICYQAGGRIRGASCSGLHLAIQTWAGLAL